MENSPNSIGEAMILGTPIVSADVGGISTICKDQIEGFLYPAGEIKALSSSIQTVFQLCEVHSDRIEKMSRAARLHSKVTHNGEANFKRLLEIYQLIGME